MIECIRFGIRTLIGSALVALFTASGIADDVVSCPDTITVKQKLAQPVSGWTEGSDELPNRFASVTFYAGPPEQKASLANQGETHSKGRDYATWNFGSETGNRIWIACGYAGTNIVLSHPLAKGVSRCTVTYNPRQSIAGLPLIERIVCK